MNINNSSLNGINTQLLKFAIEQPKIASELLQQSIQRLDTPKTIFTYNNSLDTYA